MGSVILHDCLDPGGLDSAQVVLSSPSSLEGMADLRGIAPPWPDKNRSKRTCRCVTFDWILRWQNQRYRIWRTGEATRLLGCAAAGIIAPHVMLRRGRELKLIKAKTHCLELYRTHYNFLFQPDNISVYCFSVQIDSSFLFEAIKQISAIFIQSDSLSEMVSFNVISKFKTEGKALHFALKIWQRVHFQQSVQDGQRCLWTWDNGATCRLPQTLENGNKIGTPKGETGYTAGQVIC